MLPGKTYTPREFLQMARRHFWLLVIPPIITLFGALLYSSTLPDQYQSDMLIAVIPQRVPDDFVRSTVTVGVEERLNAITVLISSRSILEPIIADNDLYPVERSRLPMEDVLDRMRKSITVDPETGGPGNQGPRAFHVRFSYTDPAIAATVTERLGSIFIDQNARDRGAQAEATDQFLDGKLAEARQRLEAQDRLMEEFREKHGKELPTQLQSNMAAVQSAQMQIQSLVEASARDRDRKLMLERLYQEAANEPLVTAVTPSPSQNSSGGAVQGATAQQQLAAARISLANLELRLTPQHPDVIRMKALIAELEPKAAAEAEKTGAGATTVLTPEEAQRRERLRQMRAEVESLDRQTAFKESEEAKLRAQLADYQSRIEAVPGIETEWAKLTRDYDTLQAAYKDLLTKSEASKVSVDLENRRIGEQFRVVDPARVPVKPIAPKRPQITAVGFLIGLLLGPGIAALLEFRDASFRSEADVVQLLSLPVLATIPLVESAGEHRSRLRRLWLAAVAVVLVVAGAGYVFWTMRLWTFAV